MLGTIAQSTKRRTKTVSILLEEKKCQLYKGGLSHNRMSSENSLMMVPALWESYAAHLLATENTLSDWEFVRKCLHYTVQDIYMEK
jgi:hypothetical protein